MYAAFVFVALFFFPAASHTRENVRFVVAGCFCVLLLRVQWNIMSPFVATRGNIVNRTYGIHKNLPGIYLPIFTNNIWCYLLWSPVIFGPICILWSPVIRGTMVYI